MKISMWSCHRASLAVCMYNSKRCVIIPEVHEIDTSSSCPQPWTLTFRWQAVMSASVPVHRTLLKNIGPLPAPYKLPMNMPSCVSVLRIFINIFIGFGMDCPKTLLRRQHFHVSGVDLNPSSSNSHTRILSSNCTFDTIVVLVVMFIT